MSKKIIIKIITLVVLFGVCLIVSPVFAEGGNEGGDGGGSDSLDGCKAANASYPAWTLDTCVGAEWRYYKTTSNSVTIRGKNSSYAKGTTITGCASAGGYWRYAMVAGKAGTYSGGDTYSKGDQVGVIGMAGNDSTTFDSTYWGGGMNYYSGNTKRDEMFKKVGEEYKKAQKLWPDIFTKGWNKNSDLSWFCAEDPTTVTYYAESNVSNRSTKTAPADGSGAVSTGIVKDAKTTRSEDRTVEVGEKVSVTFSHNSYADHSKSGVSWGVTRTVKMPEGGKKNGFNQNTNSTIYYMISSSQSKYSWGTFGSSQTGTADITETRTGKPEYIAKGTGSSSSRKKTDGTRWYVSRDYYEITFLEAGTYDFCETFSVNGKAITTVCSKIEVERGKITGPAECRGFEPANYNPTRVSGTSWVVSKVKNSTTGTDWESSVYAKPGDKTKWRHCYYPGAQMVANTPVTEALDASNTFDGLHGKHDSTLGSGGTTNNSYRPLKDFYDWTSELEIIASGFRTPEDNKSTYDIGDANGKIMKDSYTIEKSKVGKTLKEKGYTYFPTTASVTSQTHNWECNSGKSTCTHANTYVLGNASGTSRFGRADVLVPYNFNNTASIEIKDSVVYAGETTSFSSLAVHVGTRTNEVTKGDYATKVSGAKIKIISYASRTDHGNEKTNVKSSNICDVIEGSISGYCHQLVYKTGLTLNSTNEKEGATTEISNSTSYNVYDLPAGNYYCVVLAVYPASSGIDTMMETTGSDSWYVSAPSCVKIAKKPNLQVWGSGMFSNGSVTTPYAEKRIVNGYWDYNTTSKQNITFGSWVEQNIVTNGLVSMASGASDGLAGKTARTYNGTSNGSFSNNINQLCILSPLTMPNSKCSTAMGPGGSTNSMGSPNDKSALIARFTTNDSSEDFELHNTCTLNGAPSLGPDDVKTHVYKCNGDLSIGDDIIAFTENYSKLTEIPKIIVYAKNIKISCRVNRIDAVLIADSGVYTCSEVPKAGEASNYQIASNRLTINGTVITDKLYAWRTYGAATGESSYEAAEIINYDTSLYLWGAPRADLTGSGKLESVYQTELAPRY
ncbi:hypothetical protein IJH24_01960 [Candidatus Saccharibacteria bacterium]|nr:hypothetical protein [Candidatus Saccharibacteria bacterium]